VCNRLHARRIRHTGCEVRATMLSSHKNMNSTVHREHCRDHYFIILNDENSALPVTLKFALVSFAIKAGGLSGFMRRFALTICIQPEPTQEFRLHFMHHSLFTFLLGCTRAITRSHNVCTESHIMWLVGRQSNALQHTRRAASARN
jgi:hypothetical protein